MKRITSFIVVALLLLTTTAWAYTTPSGGAQTGEQTGIIINTSGDTTIVTSSYTAQPQRPANSTGVGLVVGGKTVQINNDVQPYINQDNRTLIPVRLIATLLGCEVSYNANTGVITIQQGLTTITLTVGSKNVTVNGKTVVLDTAVEIFQGRAVVPLRFVSEALGHQVDFTNGIITVK